MSSSKVEPVSSTAPSDQQTAASARDAEATELPAGFPAHIKSDLAWSGQDYASSTSYIHFLTDRDIKEVEEGVELFKTWGLDGDKVSRENFPLPNLGPKLDKLRRELYDGKGFALVRGINPNKYTLEDGTLMYLGIQSYLSSTRGRQDKVGNMLVHIVADDSTALKASHHRHSTAPITFHNEEAGDVVSWFTKSTASQGGRCIIASAYTVYNVLAATRPDLVRLLARSDWPFAIPRFQCRPIIFNHEGRLVINFGRTPLMGSDGHPRPAHLPELSAGQKEALDAIESIAQATQLEIATQTGDMHFINNLAVFHRREGFVDGQTDDQKRHLVRMRLRDEELGWSIPPALQDEWSRAFDDERPQMWHLEPSPDGYFPLRSYAN
ncbi:TfdA family oxidoreductase [Stachybotrys elegans]|uniref:TfdA family oxidoreductase n=1 Tax=Stachybotrys elegans TaxID=80388 RepID=A0A8K0T2K8_9HYPO|nr:TfdA family oxidoreductase [Stachybotrys elegans]